MIDIATLTIGYAAPCEFTVMTSAGPAVLRMRRMDADNHAFIADMLARERSKPTEGAEPPPVTAKSLRDSRESEAADLHRWCFESLAIGGVACTFEEGLQFLQLLAATSYVELVKIARELRSAPKEANADAIAGE